jgi:4-amino-4-deoxy-L-arabinose transferase-like glycosyltransferase
MVSLIASVLSMLLVAWIGWRFFGPWVGVLGAWFMACNFTELGLSRRAWSDGLAGLFGLVIVAIACKIADYKTPSSWCLRRIRRLNLILWFAAFFLAGTIGMLTKETVTIGYAACGLLLVAFAALDRDWMSVSWLVAGGAGSIVLALAVLCVAAGGVGVALSALPHVQDWFHIGTDRNGYLRECCSGPAWHFPAVLATTGPCTAILALLGVPLALRSPQAKIGALLAILVVLYLGISTFGPAFQYLRFISPANGAYCLLAAIAGVRIARWAWEDFGAFGVPAVAALALVVIAYGCMEYGAYVQIVVRSGMEDLAVNTIRTVQSSLQ